MVSMRCGGKVVVVVQARMGSVRLPNKMMLWLHGHPIISWVYHRLSYSLLASDVVYALPDTSANDILHYHLENLGASVFRGSEADVLGRLTAAAKHYNASIVVRVCADNPFVTGSEVDRLIKFFDDHACDYAYNHIPKNNLYPDGLGAEITTLEILNHLDSVASTPRYREHVFDYLWAETHQFSIKTFDPPSSRLQHPQVSLDLDTLSDYQKLLKYDVEMNSSAEDVVAAALRSRRRFL